MFVMFVKIYIIDKHSKKIVPNKNGYIHTYVGMAVELSIHYCPKAGIFDSDRQ